MTIFEALREDHDKQRTLLELLTSTEGDSGGREELFSRTRDALQAHAVAEERCFYIPLIAEDLTQEKARHSVAEHHEIDELLETLAKTDFSSPGWLANARKLRDMVLHHLDEEEQEVFQLAGRVLSENNKRELAGQYRSEMQTQARK